VPPAPALFSTMLLLRVVETPQYRGISSVTQFRMR
jgi:hypothetical protein